MTSGRLAGPDNHRRLRIERLAENVGAALAEHRAVGDVLADDRAPLVRRHRRLGLAVAVDQEQESHLSSSSVFPVRRMRSGAIDVCS